MATYHAPFISDLCALCSSNEACNCKEFHHHFDIKFKSSYGTRKDKYYRKAKTLNITFTVEFYEIV